MIEWMLDHEFICHCWLECIETVTWILASFVYYIKYEQLKDGVKEDEVDFLNFFIDEKAKKTKIRLTFGWKKFLNIQGVELDLKVFVEPNLEELKILGYRENGSRKKC